PAAVLRGVEPRRWGRLHGASKALLHDVATDLPHVRRRGVGLVLSDHASHRFFEYGCLDILHRIPPVPPGVLVNGEVPGRDELVEQEVELVWRHSRSS